MTSHPFSASSLVAQFIKTHETDELLFLFKSIVLLEKGWYLVWRLEVHCSMLWIILSMYLYTLHCVSIR